jgi:hypothetical protein
VPSSETCLRRDELAAAIVRAQDRRKLAEQAVDQFVKTSIKIVPGAVSRPVDPKVARQLRKLVQDRDRAVNDYDVLRAQQRELGRDDA